MQKADKEFLESYIKSFAIISNNKTVVITNADNKKCLFASQPLIKLLKLRYGDLDGKRLLDVAQIKPYADEYAELFNKVIETKSPLSALIAHYFDDNGIKTLKCLDKEPIISPITGEVLGVIDEIRDFSINHEFTQFLNFINKSAGIVINSKVEKPINLTKRQKEIIFLLSLGKSPKNIADFISRVENKILSSATVTAIINKHLYVRFGVSSTSQLIEKAILLRFVDNVPESFIRKSGVLMILD